MPLTRESRTHSIFVRQTLFRFPADSAITLATVRRATLILATSVVAVALALPNVAAAQTAGDAAATDDPTTGATAVMPDTTIAVDPEPGPTTVPPTAAPPTEAPPPLVATPMAPPDTPPPAEDAAPPGNIPKVKGVGDSVFLSAQSKVLTRLQPEYQPRFRSVLGATVSDMTPQARRMASNDPHAMVVGLGNPDIAEMDSGLDPYPAATLLLEATIEVPCVVWINVKQRGVNGYYNVNWRRDAMAFDNWLVDASVDGPGNDLHFANLHVLDWNRATVGHPGWFRADGLHLNEIGQANYARKIDRFLNRVCPP